jgi:hypothetical protein
MKSDAEIMDDVINELHWNPQVTEPEAIGVAVRDGAVTLTGHVPSYAEKLAAARAVTTAATRCTALRLVQADLHAGQRGERCQDGLGGTGQRRRDQVGEDGGHGQPGDGLRS